MHPRYSLLRGNVNYDKQQPKLLQGRAFPAMEPVSAAPAGGSASRSRASQDKGLPVRLSGAGMEKWRRRAPALQHRTQNVSAVFSVVRSSGAAQRAGS